MEGFLKVRSIRARAEDFEFWSGHELVFQKLSLQFLQLLIVFRGANIISHVDAREHHAETDTSTTNPDAVRIDSETTSIGEVSSDDGHGAPVVCEWMICVAPFRVFVQEVIDRCRFVHVVTIAVTLG
jgi:hypothetical protein